MPQNKKDEELNTLRSLVNATMLANGVILKEIKTQFSQYPNYCEQLKNLFKALKVCVLKYPSGLELYDKLVQEFFAPVITTVETQLFIALQTYRTLLIDMQNSGLNINAVSVLEFNVTQMGDLTLYYPKLKEGVLCGRIPDASVPERVGNPVEWKSGGSGEMIVYNERNVSMDVIRSMNISDLVKYEGIGPRDTSDFDIPGLKNVMNEIFKEYPPKNEVGGNHKNGRRTQRNGTRKRKRNSKTRNNKTQRSRASYGKTQRTRISHKKTKRA